MSRKIRPYRGWFMGLSLLDQIRLGDEIRTQVAAEFAIPESALRMVQRGGRRDPRLSRARCQAVIRMRLANMSWSAIASALGYQDSQGPYYLLRQHGRLEEVATLALFAEAQ